MVQRLIYTLLLLIPFCGYGQDEPAAYAVSDEFTMWNLSSRDTAYVHADVAYLRDQPSLNGRVVDSLAAGAMVQIVSPAYGGNKIKGFHAPWQQVAYNKDNTIKRAFIWIGLLALGKQKDASGQLFIYGFDRFIPSTKESPDRYLCSIKLFDKQQRLRSKYTFGFDYAGQSFTESKLLPSMGLRELKQIFRISFLGEACGIPSNHYYAGWNGAMFIELPMRYTVSDAGVYYYEESMLFPSEHRKEANVIYKLIEEGEAHEEVEDLAELSYDIKKKQEKFLWNGKGFNRLPQSK
ncbi:SH3 domain-containing protein [Sphingobacterium griseoflavum]|uniref:SH3b domain-containing protein n=1 Tax=Sphingobacterium griseoflavum TaxID=1474952 RepID=A0ABQ3HWK8_9SPHI|nr:hypothetical protein [Sphingobacterium griseoflavum]GHE30404.1 hypothetical protein GCM10017764_11650 [Sphingobacterium griseoflavum]